MAPPSHPLAECEAGGMLSSEGSEQRQSQASLFFFKITQGKATL